MIGLENIVKEVPKAQLGETDPLKSYSKEGLNNPIEKQPSDTKENNSDIKEQKRLSTHELNSPIENEIENSNERLSLSEKAILQKETGWSDNIIDSVRNIDEANVYKEAGLKEVNGNLERSDINWNAKIPQDRIDRMRSLYGDETANKWGGKTNLDLIKEGKAPYGLDNEQVNLHHIGQKPDSPLAELTNTEHKINDGILHDKTKTSEIERNDFRIERKAYWQHRYEELTGNQITF